MKWENKMIEDARIISNVEIAKDVYKMELETQISKLALPGQFIEISVPGFFLRRPISINEIKENSIVIIYKVLGEGTKVMTTVNNEEINDILDYKYQMFDEYVTLLIEKPNGEQWDLEIEQDENEDIGLIFEEELMDKPRRCANHCIFCFMDQLPDKVRETLVFKDDDFRLSFMTGPH